MTMDGEAIFIKIGSRPHKLPHKSPHKLPHKFCTFAECRGALRKSWPCLT